MRYSDVIGDIFYKIRLNPEASARVDQHFISAAHHRWRFYTAKTPDGIRYHHRMYFEHLFALLRTVMGGDFTHAVDLSQRGLNSPLGWSPARFPVPQPAHMTEYDHLLPSPKMFDAMDSDIRFKEGIPHLYDQIFDPSVLKKPTKEDLASLPVLDALAA